ncbi:hypothetical protein ACFXJ5_41225 [Streptomyces sp. NPDC059373]
MRPAVTPRAASCSIWTSTSNGSIRLGQVARGSVVLGTASGDLEVGTAAWLDVHSGSGQVSNTLDASEAPEKTEDTVEVHARTRHGNIDIRRARA